MGVGQPVEQQIRQQERREMVQREGLLEAVGASRAAT
jgi:hypothetical protein